MNAQSKTTSLCSELAPLSSDSSESSSSSSNSHSNSDNNGKIESSNNNNTKKRKMNSSKSLVQMLLNPKTAESSPKRTTEEESNSNSSSPSNSQPRSWKRHRRSISQEGDLQLDVIHVPKDYKCLEEAVQYANQAFQRSQQGTQKTITILIDPSSGTLELQSPLEVNTGGEGSKLILTSAASQMATLVYETRIANQPLIQLIQGRVELENLSLEHSSSVDLITLMTRANHNAAVVVCRPPVGNQETNSLVSLKNVVLRSYTGKGIINHSSYCTIVQDDLRIFNPLF